MSVPGNKQTTPPSPLVFIPLPELNDKAEMTLEGTTDPGLSTKTTEVAVLAPRDSQTSAALAANPAAKIEFPAQFINSTTGDIINDIKTQKYLIKNLQRQFQQGLNATLSAHTLERNLETTDAAKKLLASTFGDARQNLISGPNITPEAQQNLNLLADGSAHDKLAGQNRSKVTAHKPGYSHVAIQEFFNSEATPQAAGRLINILNNLRKLA